MSIASQYQPNGQSKHQNIKQLLIIKCTFTSLTNNPWPCYVNETILNQITMTLRLHSSVTCRLVTLPYQLCCSVDLLLMLNTWTVAYMPKKGSMCNTPLHGLGNQIKSNCIELVRVCRVTAATSRTEQSGTK